VAHGPARPPAGVRGDAGAGGGARPPAAIMRRDGRCGGRAGGWRRRKPLRGGRCQSPIRGGSSGLAGGGGRNDG
jgi:hypothetical protein